MNEVGDDCRKLLAEVEKRLGFPGEKELREEPRYYPDSLALCLIDSSSRYKMTTSAWSPQW